MKLRHYLAAMGLALLSGLALADKVVNYTIDPMHTQVRFSWAHMGFSHPVAVFKEVTGSIQGNQDKPELSVVEVSMPVRALDSFVPLLNEHLLESGDYFKAREFPVVTFKSSGMRKINRKARTFELLGELTVNGITKPVVLQARANTVGPHLFYENAPAAGFDAKTVIKRSDFGMSKYVPMVSDELKVDITVEAVEAQAYQKMLDKQKAEAEKTRN